MNPLEIFDFISRGGVAGVLGYILWKLFKGDIRMGREVEEKEITLQRLLRERNKWQDIAFEALHLGDKITTIAENGNEK